MVRTLVDEFDANPETAIHKLNEWVFTLYGLSRSDRLLVQDTLATQMPYTEVQQRASAPAHPGQIDEFRQELENHLQPYFNLTGERISVHLVDSRSAGWKFLSISTDKNWEIASLNNNLETVVNALADHHGYSRAYIEQGQGRLILGILTQFRYWTPTRARLCALHILRHYSELFPIPTDQDE